MKRTRFGRRRSLRRKAQRRSQKTRTSLENLETRCLLTVSAAFSASTGVLSVISDSASDSITVSYDSSGNVMVNGGSVSIQGDVPTSTNTMQVSMMGGGGDDVLAFDETNGQFPGSYISGGDGNDSVYGTSNADTLLGGDGNDKLVGNQGGDFKYGDEGDDLIVWNNGDGSDFMEGGTGSDSVAVYGSDGDGDILTVSPSSSTDRVQFERQNLGLFQLDIGTTESLQVNGQDGDDIISASEDLEDLIALTFNGGDGDDYLSGSEGDDLLNGGLGNDTLIGNVGDDSKYGDEGDDLIVWNNGDGSDFMEGGTGSDSVQVNAADGGDDILTVSPSSTTDRVQFERENLGLFQLDIGTTEDLEVNGQDGDDIISASEDLEDLIALTFNGGDGDDLLSGSDGDDLLNGGLGNDTLIGNIGDDSKYGDEGDDLIVWNNGDGSDFMEGGTGADQVQVNAADGGDDILTVSPSSSTDRVQFERQNLGLFQLDIGTTEDLEVNGQDGDDVISASEDLEDLIALTFNGGDGDDFLSGSDGDDLLNGGLGNDTLIGNRGDDFKYGDEGDDLIVWNNGDGSDFMEGGTGSDSVQVNAADGDGDILTVSPSSTDRVQFERQNLGLFQLDIGTTEDLEVNGQDGDDIISASEDLEDLIALTFNGGDGDDLLSGSDGDDLLNGGLGNDTLIGNRGDDFKYGDEGDDLIVWNNGDGSDFMEGGTGSDSVQVNAADGADDILTVSPSSTTDRVQFERENLGLFQLDLGTVEDLEVNGQDGDDIISASEDLEDLIALTFNGGDGDDYLAGSDGDDLLNGGLGNDTLIGNVGDDSKYGDEGDDLIVWNNGDGSDFMEGGTGSDQVQVNGADGSGDEFSVTPSTTTGRVQFERENLGLFQLDLGTVEDLEVNGQSGDDIIRASDDLEDLIALTFNGGEGDDFLSGSDGDDLLNGGLGNDTLIGNEGDDLIVWNNDDGSDLIDGGDGSDTVQVNGADGDGDILTVSPGSSTDRVQFERENLGLFQLDIGTVEDLEVNGQDGDDVITASEDLEDLIALTFNGGDGDDYLSGSDGDDLLNGGLGNDTLIGNRGDDFKYGDEGDDLIVWNNGDGSDFMEGGTGSDSVQVNGADSAGDEFSVTPSSTTDRVRFERNNLGLFQLDIGTAEDLEVNGQDGDDIIQASDDLEDLIALTFNGGDGDDYLSGSDGDDLLNGGLGNDTLIGNGGNDFKYGDEGDDLIVWNNGDGSDFIEGGDGSDETAVYGSESRGDFFTANRSPVPTERDRLLFRRRNLGRFNLNIGTTETLNINGQGGRDRIIISNVQRVPGFESVYVSGGSGNDFITGAGIGFRPSSGTSTDSDQVSFTVDGGDGRDLIFGSRHNDVLSGGNDDDRIYGLRGDDSIFGDDGNDRLFGGFGRDFIDGGDGFDFLFGGRHSDSGKNGERLFSISQP